MSPKKSTKQLQLTGALRGLRVLGISDHARYKDAVEAGEQLGWGYYFPYLLTRHRDPNSVVLVGEDSGSLCVFLWRQKESVARLELLVAPTPMNAAVLRRALERANDHNGDRSARVMRIDEHDRDQVRSLPEVRVKARKAQYMYAPDAFGDLAGRKYRNVRRFVARVEENENLEVIPFSPDHVKDCQKLLRSWGKQHREAHGTSGGVGTSRRALELAGVVPEADLRGEIILIDGVIKAFSLGGEIRPGVGCFLDAKSDPDVAGLSYFQRYSFLSKQLDLSIVNDGSDVGRDGLRQLKESLRPVAMHTEYRGFQRDI